MKKFIIAVLVLALLGGGGYAAYHFYFEKKADSEERVSSTADNAVYVDRVSEITGFGNGTGLVERFGGEVSPQATLEVKLEGDRTVKECFVKEGDEVKEGQRLFSYDTRDDEDKLAQAEIDIDKAQGDIELAEQSIKQYEKDKKEADSDEQLMITTSILSAQNEIKQYEYDIKSKQLEMEQLKETIDNSTVTAEMAGIIQKISDPNGDSQDYYGSGGDSAYITILAIGDYRIKGTVNEQNLAQIQEGMTMLVHSRVDDTLTWTGTVSEISTENVAEEEDNGYYYGMSNDAGSSNYNFYVELDDSEGLILGQHVYMEEDLGQTEEKTGMWLEEYYIMQEDDGKAYVWFANKSNTIEKHEITIGDYDEELMEYEVLDGLEPEDYIAYPLDTVSEGDPVIYNDIAAEGDMGMDDMSYDDMGMDDMSYYDADMDDMSYDDMGMDDMSYDDADMDDMSYDDSDMDDMSYDDADMDDMSYDDADMDDMSYDDSDMGGMSDEEEVGVG